MRTARTWTVSALIAIAALAGGCSKTDNGPDPASANLAPAVPYGQPAVQGGGAAPTYEAGYSPLDVAPTAPPPLPEYSQPECPGPDSIWTPGYWSYSDAGYYWVPGAWVPAPYAGALWTPPYWAYADGRYRWHSGYWGPHIGFYGGINYGFGYVGFGYDGGYWNNGAFFYNRAVNRVNTQIVHNVYDHPVTNVTPFNRIAYNGGPGGIARRPEAAEMAAQHEAHTGPLPAQMEHVRMAASDRGQFAAENHGRPATVAASRPLAPTNAPAAGNGPAPMERAPQRFGRGETPGGRPAGPYIPRDQQSARPQPAQPNSADRRMPEERQTVPAPRRVAPVEQRPSPFEMRRETQPRPGPRTQARQPGPQTPPHPAAQPEARPAPAPPQQQRPAAAPPRMEPPPHPAPPKDDRQGHGGR